MGSLFDESFSADEPLAKKLAPASIDDFYGQEKIAGADGAVRKTMIVLSLLFFRVLLYAEKRLLQR